VSTVSVDSSLLVKRWIFSASAPRISASFALMPPKESLFSTLRKTVVFFRLTRTYLRDAALATRARRRLDGVSRRPPQLWCLSYLDTARHICGDAIEAQGCPTYSSGGRLCGERRTTPEDFEGPAIWVEKLRFIAHSVSPVRCIASLDDGQNSRCF
jgi:hypothetical protein